jgi:hypothetical protein
MKKTLFITREVDGSFTSTPCNNHSTIKKNLVMRVIWHDNFEKDIIDHIENCNDSSMRSGLIMALRLYDKQKKLLRLLPAMFITEKELDTMTASMISQKQETIKEVII